MGSKPTLENYFKNKKKSLLYGLFCVVLIFVTVFLTHSWDKNHSFSEPKLTKNYLQNTNYKFIKPSLTSEVGDKKEFLEYIPLQKNLMRIINKAKTDGRVNDASVYFRDMELGHWTGINEDALYSPGSLLKVPLLIAYFDSAQDNPSILEKNIIFEAKDKTPDIQAIEPAESIKVGESYKTSELIRRMIVYSDNNATNLLFNNIDHNALKDVFSDLGLKFDEQTATQDFISPKQFSLFFRILFNSSYLSRSYSESALELLTQTTFKDGLEAGVPGNVEIAHKFGERELIYATNNNKEVELHDCGVVYFPNNPYTLCIMTKGQNLTDLKNIIKDISTTVYETVENKYK
jgi:beta-lactamase class A